MFLQIEISRMFTIYVMLLILMKLINVKMMITVADLVKMNMVAIMTMIWFNMLGMLMLPLTHPASPRKAWLAETCLSLSTSPQTVAFSLDTGPNSVTMGAVGNTSHTGGIVVSAAPHGSAIHCTVFNYTTLHRIALHYSAPNGTALHCIAPDSTPLHCTTTI